MNDTCQDSLVSVVVPTLNRCYSLPRALDSILGQTRRPNEIIVVDNGSTDDTEILLRNRYPKIRFIKEAKPGVSAARNRGISLVNSTWVAFLDSDDAWVSSKLEKQLKAARANPNFRIIHTDELWYRKGRQVNPGKRHKKRGGDIFNYCLDLCCISPSSVLMKKSLFNEVGLFDEKLLVCEDYDMWLRISAREEIFYVDDPLTIKHGGHHDQLSKKYWGMDRFRIESLEKLLHQGCLSDIQKKATVATLVKRLKIVINGAIKRNNADVINFYSQKLKRANNFIFSDFRC